MIYVRNVQKDSVQRRHQLPVVVGRNPNKPGSGQNTGKTIGHNKAEGVRDRLQFVGDRQKGLFKTGLTEHMSNPFRGEEIVRLRGRFRLPNSWKDELLKEIVDAETISLQNYYEILDGVDYDFYTSRMRDALLGTNTVLAPDKTNATFIEKFAIDLIPGTNVFTTETSRGRIAIQLLKNHPMVAPSMDVVNGSQHIWMIVQEAEEEMKKNKDYREENKASAVMSKLEESHTEFAMYQIAVVLGLVSGETTKAVVEAALNRYIRESGTDKSVRISKFMETTNWFFTELDRFTVQYYVAQGLNVNVLYSGGGYVFWGKYKDQSREERYQWNSKEVLVNFLLEEHKKFDPKKKNEDNGFFSLMTDLVERGVKIKG